MGTGFSPPGSHLRRFESPRSRRVLVRVGLRAPPGEIRFDVGLVAPAGGEQQVLPVDGPVPQRAGRQVGEGRVQGGGALGVVADVPVDGDDRPVGGLEELKEVPRGAERVHADRLPTGDDVGDPVAEQRPHVLLLPPQWRRLHSRGRRRRIRLEGGEHATDEPFGGPTQQPDRATGPADSYQLVRGGPVVRGEHDADAGHHRVERGVLERQRLGVGLLPAQDRSARLGLPAPHGQQFGSEVRGDHIAAGQRGGDRGVPRPCRDVQHPVPLLHGARVHQDGAEPRHDTRRDRRVVAERPHRPVLGLEREVCLAGVR